MRRAKETILALYHEASLDQEGGSKKLAAHAIASERSDRLRAMIDLAASEPGVAVLAQDLDSNHWLLNVKNGTINLRTGDLLPHRRDDLITKLAPTTYDPKATHPMLDSFMEKMVPGLELRAYLQRAYGMTLTGDTSEEVLQFVHGPTNAGKSTVTEAFKATLGDYATTADFETFIRKRDRGIPNDIARLAGARMVLSLEVEEGKTLAVSLVKSLTGGDTIAARFLHKEFFEFRPQFKLWLVANHKPTASHKDGAIWRRIHVLPFTVELAKKDRDSRVKKTLRDSPEARSALLAWGVRGCIAWQREGLNPPACVLQATETYRAECDPLSGFLSEKCLADPSAKTSSEDLYKAYTTWCEENDEKALTTQTFGREISSRGYAKCRASGGARGRQGIRLGDASDSSDARIGIFDHVTPPEENYPNPPSLPSLPSLDLPAQEALEERLAIQEAEA